MNQKPSVTQDQRRAETSTPESRGDEMKDDRTRRHFLVAATVTTGLVGAGSAIYPFAASFRPSAKARAIGSPVTVDLTRLEAGQQVTVVWRGRPIWILLRTPDMLERLNEAHWRDQLRDPDSTVETQQPPYAKNATRSIRPEYLVVTALCTHLGCVPSFHPEVASEDFGEDWLGGYFCPCHGSRFDLAGRVTKNVPAPTNLIVPPHRYLNPDFLEIGVDTV